MTSWIERLQRAARRVQDWWDRLRGKDKHEPEHESEFPTGLVWLGPDISGWPVVSDLDADVRGSTLHLRYSHSRTWPVARQKAGDGGDLVGNAWVIVQVNGTWHAATFEWMRHGQQSKSIQSVRGTGGHIQQAPLATWTGPRSGERIGLIVSTPARGSERTVNQRAKAAFITWP